MRSKGIVLGSILSGVIAACAVAPASAGTYRVLYSFCHGNKFVCKDGKDPAAGLVQDKDGNYFGTASAGGALGNGVIFELKKKHDTYVYRVLHSFDGNAEGGTPVTQLVIDTAGNLYGTAVAGGSNFGGTAFELSPGADKSWTYTVIQNFCTQIKPDCVQGSVPQSALTYAGASDGALYDGTSPLYGTTLEGPSSPGVVYALTPASGGFTGSVLYNFCAQANCADGSNPEGQIALDSSGNLYGTTFNGGNANGVGVAYRLDTTSGTYTVLHTFCSLAACADGSNPAPGLTLAGKTLYGATSLGGNANNGGTVYTLNPGSGKENVLYAFCPTAGCADGEGPISPVLRTQGTSIGTAQGGDASADGVIYQVGASGAETVLYTFCQAAGCVDGALPVGVTTGTAGNYIGVTSRGGFKNQGAIFQLTP
jgi:uncharacterized repeat protein (TIGR03803 family)